MTKHIRRALGVLTAVALPLTGMVILAQPAAAAVETISCGEQVNHSLTAANDIGPCPGDGLDIVASGITVDLGGHTITGNNTANTTANEQVGVHLMGVSGVTVRNGTVRNFDAGVAIEGGSANTITGLRVHDNINHAVAAGTFNECNYGDGIVADNSNNNRIQGNQAVHNGPFDGIGLVDNSDNNVVSGNQVANQTVSNQNRAFVDAQNNPEGAGPCGPFGGGVANFGPTGRLHQDIGIRVEGPGADNNTVSGNQVTGNQLTGISIHGYVCHPENAGAPPGTPPQPNNGGNMIRGNQVSNNGFAGPTELADGIAILSQGPGNVVCVSYGNSIIGNASTANAEDGIFVGGRGTHDNTINQNVVRNNGRDGIHLTGPGSATSRCGPATPQTSPCPGAVNNTLTGNQGTGNAAHDGFDGNPNCDNNRWISNIFRTVNQACVASGATIRP